MRLYLGDAICCARQPPSFAGRAGNPPVIASPSRESAPLEKASQPFFSQTPCPHKLVDVVAKRCNALDANSLYLIGHRSDLVVTLQVIDLPEAESIEPVIAMLADVFRAVDPLLTR